jgi:hypothetical protein
MFSSNTSSAAGDANYIEDVFSTYLYTGNGSTQTITNGIDLAGKGGLTWIKARSGPSTQSNWLFDTARGAGKGIRSDTTSAEYNGQGTDWTQSFLSNGFSFNSSNGAVNNSSYNYASWTFREQPKFFDVVTYTGNGASSQTIAHNLGAAPGCIIVKRTDSTSDWYISHRSESLNMKLNTDEPVGYSPSLYINNSPTSTTFTVGQVLNANGGTFVAYIFAHDAGGFGLTGTDNVISCGSFTVSSGTGSTDVNLGYEPQWLLAKPSTDPGFGTNWNLYDTMRGWVNTTTAGNVNKRLNPNLAQQETSDKTFQPTATGFTMLNSEVYPGTSITYIYIAIRRGPMKVPTTGTSVFEPVIYTGDGTASRVITAGAVSVVDMAINKLRDDPNSFVLADRLRGLRYLETNSTSSELTSIINFDLQNGVRLGNGASPYQNVSTYNYVEWNFKRAPGFFDEVCYTGTGSATTVAHNLAAVPEMMIVKARSQSSDWTVYGASVWEPVNRNYLRLNLTGGAGNSNGDLFQSAPTSSVFSVTTSAQVNGSGATYVNYLFATCPGVSKVGSYTGTATTLQINCGFTAGARFVLIKRTDSTGDWYVWDSARGIVSGDDPYLRLNSSGAEISGTDYVDTFSSGFEISSTAPSAINANGGTFIFLAIA